MPSKKPSSRRIVVPLIVAGVALGLVMVVIFGRPDPAAEPPANGDPATQTEDVADADAQPNDTDDADSVTPDPQDTPTAQGDPDNQQPSPADAQDYQITGTLSADPPGEGFPDPPRHALGSLDWRTDRMQVVFAPRSAGIEAIVFSDIWETAAGKRQAEQIKDEIVAGAKTVADLPADERYVLSEVTELEAKPVPVLAAHSLMVNGRRVSLFGNIWRETAPGEFVTEIVETDDDGNVTPLLRLTRRFVLGDNAFDLTLTQSVENLTGGAIVVQWIQYGPGDLRADRSAYMDRRRFRFGYLYPITSDPSRYVHSEDDLLFERQTVFKNYQKSLDATAAGDGAEALERRRLWPNETSIDDNLSMSWFASTNRYFALAIHPVIDDPETSDRALTDVVEQIQVQASNRPAQGKVAPDSEVDELFTYLFSPTRTLAPGSTTSFDLGIYAGPLSRDVLKTNQPYVALKMGGLIFYQLSSFCAICTFQWLAQFLIWFLSLVHAGVFDWGVAIILLVVLVRLLLHPITKRSQINIQRFSKQMQKLKPEMDKLKAKYPNDPKKIQEEQFRLYREHNINPISGVLGCAPMFLQMPIWVALYAMLYFAYELRHEPAFWGVFQTISGGYWPFLADLSAGDHFLGEFDRPFMLFGLLNITGINLLPILMGVIFYIQQKYMSPPSQGMSPEMERQQKIMKIVFPLMFPIMLYSAPSGLTLYILTSSIWGIIESRYVRAHIDQMDLSAPKKVSPAKAKRRDMMARAYEKAMEERKRKQERKRVPNKSYKKRRK